MDKFLFCISFAWLLIFQNLAAQEQTIYRCEHGGVIEFSDQPCAAANSDDPDGDRPVDQTPYHPDASISVISPAADLDQIQRSNRDWLADYRSLELERLSRQRQLRSESRRARSAASRQVDQRPRLAPWNWPYRSHHAYRRSNQLPYETVQTPTRPQRYSALSGPFPGARRSVRSNQQAISRRRPANEQDQDRR